MRFKTNIDKNQWFLTPCIGVLDERFYYGYNVYSLGFAWLTFRCKVTFGLKKVKHNEKKAD